MAGGSAGDLAAASKAALPPCYPPNMLFMIIERFKNRDARTIYARLRESGRQMPDGLKYVDSWIEPNFDRCFQLMDTDDLRTLQRWILAWSDLMEFEIVPVVLSKETRAVVDAASATSPPSSAAAL
jgi:hypothetical protein